MREMSSRRYLSKTKIMAGHQCPKRLWLDVHAPEKAEVSEATERAFRMGHDVGRIAQTLWPDGILIGHDQELGEALRETAEHLEGEKPVTLSPLLFQISALKHRILCGQSAYD